MALFSSGLLTPRKSAEWLAILRVVEHVNYGRLAESLLTRFGCVIQFAMTWAEIDSMQSQWTFLKSPNGLDSVNDLQYGEFIR
jgi:hypothetical protein